MTLSFVMSWRNGLRVAIEEGEDVSEHDPTRISIKHTSDQTRAGDLEFTSILAHSLTSRSRPTPFLP